MAARKLQSTQLHFIQLIQYFIPSPVAEIDRTLKKVAEGVELFESIYDKMQASTNQTQKEKLETDLKTQIKKLQRLRDQIKTWVASNDIKDKTALLENRRLIETVRTLHTLILQPSNIRCCTPITHSARLPLKGASRAVLLLFFARVPFPLILPCSQQMEKFKACEKEMKTKAFSKEGLIQSAKLDPKAQEKLEQTQWLQTCVEELLLQVETAEAEIETLQQGGRKKGKVGATAQDRLEELERLNERRKWHISRLEIMLRLLDNGTLSTEQVQGLKDDVNYFVEDNAVRCVLLYVTNEQQV
jgi:CCR4-NOT transcription complex subunit 3